MAWWKVAYLERHRYVSVVTPEAALGYICKIYQLSFPYLYRFNCWHDHWGFEHFWVCPVRHLGSGTGLRLKIEVNGRPLDKKQIMKVMSSIKLERKDSWKRFKRPKGWFFYRARRRGQQRYNANKHSKEGNKDGNN